MTFTSSVELNCFEEEAFWMMVFRFAQYVQCWWLADSQTGIIEDSRAKQYQYAVYEWKGCHILHITVVWRPVLSSTLS